jgi:hypothetical protein
MSRTNVARGKGREGKGREGKGREGKGVGSLPVLTIKKIG